jgi:uncharacterized phage-associated protein
VTPSRVEFRLDIDKVIATVVYFSSHQLPELTPAKLFKLMFLAEKYHLVRYGRPITGDRYDAMKDGPVPSFTYDLFKKQVLKKPFSDPARRLSAQLTINKTKPVPELSSVSSFDKDQLSVSDIKALDYVILTFGNLPFSKLRKITHDMAAYDNAWRSKGNRESVPMKFEDFFEGDEDAVLEVREEVIENQVLDKVFAKR